jgi:hypothetical protein
VIFRSLGLLLSVLSISFTTSAQSDMLRWHKDVTLDAKRFNVDTSTARQMLDVNVRYQHWFDTNNFGKPRPRLVSDAVLSYRTSFLPDTTAETLRRAKIIFDLSGYHSKLLKLRVYELGVKGGSLRELQNKMDTIYLQTRDEIGNLYTQLREDSQFFGNTSLPVWESNVRDLLNSTPDIKEVARMPKAQLGVFISVSQEFFSDDTREVFKNATGGGMGLYLDVKRSRVMLDMGIGVSRTKTEIDARGYWEEGTRATHVRADLTYGWKVVNKGVALIPYVGYGVSEFTPSKTEKGDRRAARGYSPVIGLEFNKKFKEAENFYEKTTYFARASVAVTPWNNIRNYAGTQVNLKLSVGLSGSKRKYDYVKE